MPQSPTTLAGVIDAYKDECIMTRFGLNADEPRQLFYRGSKNIPDQYGFSVFGSDTIIKSLPTLSEQNYIVDGTFGVRRANEKNYFFYNLIYFLQSFPFLYVLMTRKTKRAYIDVGYIDVGYIDPVSVMSDYESGMRNAIKCVYYPKVQLRACYFHFKQALRKNTSQIPGFFNPINNCEKKNKMYHKMMSLPLLPNERILEAFAILKSESSKLWTGT